VGWIAERPDIGLEGVGMDASGDDLLAVAHKFDFLSGVTVGGDQIDGDLRKRGSGAKRDRALGRLTDAGEDTAALLEPLAYQVLECNGGRLVENIDVERRCVPSQNAGIGRAREISAPRFEHRARYVFDLLPAREWWRFADDRNGRIAVID